MGRGLLDAVLLFLVPFVVYAGILVVRRRYPFVRAAWTEGPLAQLIVAGLALAIIGVLATGLLSGRSTGAYVPAHVEHGTLVPGRMQ